MALTLHSEFLKFETATISNGFIIEFSYLKNVIDEKFALTIFSENISKNFKSDVSFLF